MIESNFGAGYPDWADLKFGFVHSIDIIEQNKSVYYSGHLNTHLGDWNQKFIFKMSSTRDSISISA